MSQLAIVAGASGAVGSAVVRALLASPHWSEVIILVRRPLESFAGVKGIEKLTTRVIDMEKLEQETAAATGVQAAFCCVGVGQPRKLPPEEVWKVDVGYAGAFARGARSAGATHVSLLSSVGANADSSNRYIKLKGSAEAAVTEAGLTRTSLFRPSLLVTKEIRYGLQDRLTQALFPIAATFLPSRFHGIRVEDLGAAMARNAEVEGSGVEILYYRDFVSLLEATRRGNAKR